MSNYTAPNTCGTAQQVWQGGGPAGMAIEALLVGPQRDGKVIYAGAATAPGLFISRDGGIAWPEFSALPPVLALAAQPLLTPSLYAGTFGGGLYQSNDEGVTWNPIASPNPYIWSLAAVQTSASAFTLYAGTDNGLYYSASPGVWAAATGPIAGKIVYAIAANPLITNELFAATSGQGVYKSADGGVSWNPSALTNISVFALAIAPSNIVYAGVSGQGVYRSGDGGSTWTPVNAGMGNLSVYALVVDPRNPQQLYAGTTGGGVFVSSNGASSWTSYNMGLSQANVYALALNASCYGTLFAGTDNGVWRIDSRATAGVVP